MIQDIAPHRLDNNYSPDIAPDNDSIIFHFHGRSALACDNDTSPFPVFSSFDSIPELHYLFSIDGKKYFLAAGKIKHIPDGYHYRIIRDLRHSADVVKENILALFTAFHLHQWYASSKFCGACGTPTIPHERERALKCPSCGNVIYPRINPAVIVGVTKGDSLLITRYAKNHGVSYDALVAGFTEVGETLEETVKREVMEETGLRVSNIRYFGSQPWGFSGGILAGFYCDACPEDEIHIDPEELSCAEWQERRYIRGQPDDYSLTNAMMMNFKNNGKY